MATDSIKTSAATTLQSAFRNKKAINEFSSKYAGKVIMERQIKIGRAHV